MRSRLFVSLLCAVALLAASAAQAGTLTSATWNQVTQGLPMTRTGTELGITGSSTADTSISADLSYPAFSTKFFVPKTPNGSLDLAISITQGGPQALTATPGMANATMGVQGYVVVRSAAHAVKGVNQSTFMTGVNSLVMVPVNVGVSGQLTGTFTVVGALHTITVDFYGWTPGTQVFRSLTSKFIPGQTAMHTKGDTTVTAAGSWALTPSGGGTVTLVTPSKISIDGSLAQRRNASFTSLRMTFVPEPGSTLVLLGAGALGLVLVGSRKR